VSPKTVALRLPACEPFNETSLKLFISPFIAVYSQSDVIVLGQRTIADTPSAALLPDA
jgi:hypothetical protein